MAAFDPIPVNDIRALNDNVLVCDMEFDARQTSSGIIIPNDNGTGAGIRPRWGRVYKIGPEQETVRVGQWVLVQHGRWTRGLDIEDAQGKKTIRKIDPDSIFLITDDEPSDLTMSEAVNMHRYGF